MCTFILNDPIFLYNLPQPIKRRLPLVAIFLSFRVLWGGGGYPPPTVRRWLRPPAVRGLSEDKFAVDQLVSTHTFQKMTPLMHKH